MKPRIGTYEVWYAVKRIGNELHKGGPRNNRTFFDSRAQLMASLRSLYGVCTNAEALKVWKAEYQEVII